jgi:hypothetical protein
MRVNLSSLIASAIVFLAIGASAHAKGDVKATVVTEIPSGLAPGTELPVTWQLADGKTGDPVDLGTGVFIRLIGPDGDATEAIAVSDIEQVGRYETTVSIPAGGVSSVEIGIHGTATFTGGRQEPSDWLMELTADPIR